MARTEPRWETLDWLSLAIGAAVLLAAVLL